MTEPDNPDAAPEPAPVTDEGMAKLRAYAEARPESDTPAWRQAQAMAAEVNAPRWRGRLERERSGLKAARRQRKAARQAVRACDGEAERARLEEAQTTVNFWRQRVRHAQRELGVCEARRERRSHDPFARLGRVAPLAEARGRPLPRRTPQARPAAQRVGCRVVRRASSSRGDPSDSAEGDGDPEGHLPRLTFPRFHSLTPGLSGAERLARFASLPAAGQDACWRDLARELEEAR